MQQLRSSLQLCNVVYKTIPLAFHNRWAIVIKWVIFFKIQVKFVVFLKNSVGKERILLEVKVQSEALNVNFATAYANIM